MSYRGDDHIYSGLKWRVTLFTTLAGGGVLWFFPHHAHYLLVLTAAALWYLGIKGLALCALVKRWPVVSGTITSIEEGSQNIAASPYQTIKYIFPIVSYDFVWNGSAHSSSRVSCERENVWVPEVDVWGVENKGRRIWDNWVVGTPVTVYVNTKKPEESVLIPHVSRKRLSHQVALIAGGTLFFIGWV